MKGKGILILIGIVLLILKHFHYIAISNWWIVLIFFVWFVLFYFSIHQKNKERSIPKPVYFSEP